MTDVSKQVDRTEEDTPVVPRTRPPFHRSTLLAIYVVGAVSFLAPGLWNALNSLGAGGALLPYLVSAANSIVFGLMGLFACLAPIVVNLIGIRWTLALGAAGFPLYSAALYQNNVHGTRWFVILGAVLCGIGAGLYWSAEGAVVLAYPEPKKRGRYLAIWLGFKNSGAIVGGAINLGLNAKNSQGGKVTPVVYLVFVALQVVAVPIALLISEPSKVIRADGTPVTIEAPTSTKQQFVELWKTVRSRKIGLLLPLFFSSWFYWGLASSFLTFYFSVRARALASFLAAITGVIAATALGFFLDSQRFSLKTRARAGGAFAFTLFSGVLVWAIIIQHSYNVSPPGKLDWTSPGFGRGFGLYLFLNIGGNVVQNYLYWSIGALSHGGTSELTRYAGLLRGVESFGQCVAFGLVSTKVNLLYVVIANCSLWAASILPACDSLARIGVETFEFKEDANATTSREGSVENEKVEV